MALVVVGISAGLAGESAEIVQRTGESEVKTVQSLLSREGIRWMFLSAVDNFIGFAPLGPVLTVMIGIGVAERTGFITMGLRLLVGAAPRSLITATLVFAGVMSSMVADAGYVVLTPLGAMLFASLGRHPIAGLTASYAAVSGGFSANLLITGLDPMLARLTGQAAQSIAPTYTVQATCNYYFMVVSVFLVTAVVTLVNTRIVEPMLGEWDSSKASVEVEPAEEPTGKQKGAFFKALGAAGVMGLVLAFLALAPVSPLRESIGPGEPAVDALFPFFESIEVLITMLFIVPGVVYGFLTGSLKNDKDVAKMAGDSMASMGLYIVLAFVAGQFVAYFNWTNLGAVLAVRGAEWLRSVGLTGILLLFAFAIVSGTMNLLVGSASAKWAFMAPIFVPMMMMMGISPEMTQVAYRVGDSVTNIISPLMPYLPIIIVFAQRYDKKAGMGTILTPMLPYSVALACSWALLLLVWIGLDIPIGPGVTPTYVPAA
jgi:aminobenzoyl-glutamate transport protein